MAGCGWDPADPASGNAWENQALFDIGGCHLPAAQELRADPAVALTRADRGRVRVRLPQLGAGAHQLTASYAGDPAVQASSSAARTLTVRPATARVPLDLQRAQSRSWITAPS
ncbi:MAG: Ig-like domain repeat protein [Actinomycetales bacterium]|nr:Ig-like domain repeat protein [Actinomycetales bacterium]